MGRKEVLNTLLQVYDANEANAIYKLIEAAWKEGYPDDPEHMRTLIKEIYTCKPIQYILGESYFYDNVIFLRYPVLIPRPETEELVHWIINDGNNGKKIWDIGTGSGCISLTLARKLKSSSITATDISPDALLNLRLNSSFYNVEIADSIHDIINEDIPHYLRDAQVIISNPPYIAESEKSQMDKNVLNHEPHNALFAEGSDPIIFYKRIAFISENICSGAEKIYLELNPLYVQNIMDSFDENIWYKTIRKDMQGKERMLKCERKTTLI